jgi:putative DNA primase/helicase
MGNDELPGAGRYLNPQEYLPLKAPPGAEKPPPHGTSAPGGYQNIAQPWYDAGCSVVPIHPYNLGHPDKKPATDWKDLQQERMPLEAVKAWWHRDHFGVAVICGAVSGNLEMLELESSATSGDALDKLAHELKQRHVLNLWDFLNHNGYAEFSPSGGLHLLYRASTWKVPGNTKLATRPATSPDGKPIVETLAETRGEGGYVVVAPTPGRCHKSGEGWVAIAGAPATIPTITWEQRQALHAAVTAAFDKSPPPPPPRAIAPRSSSLVPGNIRPGEDFNDRASWEDSWFTSQGWTVSHRASDGEVFWTRPGKDPRGGHSASTNRPGARTDCLYIWSSSTTLPIEEPHSKFYVYAHYHCGGDMAAAARKLAKEGYGSSQPARTSEVDLWREEKVKVKAEAASSSPGDYDLSDTGNGQRMKDMFGNRFLYNTMEKCWYAWTGVAWEQDNHFKVKQAAEEVTMRMTSEADQMEEKDKEGAKRLKKHAMASRNEGKLNAMVARFAAQVGVSAVPSDFDQELNLLNLQNGTYNLATGELLPHDPELRITQTFAARLDKDAECPRWQKFMEDAVPDPEVRNYVQRALGYSLLGHGGERAMFLLHGPSGTGKSVLTNTMTRLFGGYGQTAPASTFRLKRNETTLDLHKLRNKRFVATSEMPEGAQLDEELLKRITGGDEVSSRGHYEQHQEWTPRCVVWIATNFLPKVNSDDNAVWCRAKTISMPSNFVAAGTEVLKYADVLLQEADGILNWLLEGLAQYQQQRLGEPEAVTKDVEAYRMDVDTVASFVNDLVDNGALGKSDSAATETFIRSTELLHLYSIWCSEERASPFGRRRLANRLKALGYVPGKVGGHAVWFGLHRKGIGL